MLALLKRALEICPRSLGGRSGAAMYAIPSQQFIWF